MGKISPQEMQLKIKDFIDSLMKMTAFVNRTMPGAIEILRQATENDSNEFAEATLALLIARKNVESNNE